MAHDLLLVGLTVMATIGAEVVGAVLVLLCMPDPFRGWGDPFGKD